MAPTIIRVKRKLDNLEIDPKIVLNCKKPKLNEKDIYSQFSFVGTVEEKENVIPDHILKLSKKEAENIVQNKSKDFNTGLSSRLTENLEKSKEKRFKVVNFMRSTDNSTKEEAINEQIILDVERDDQTAASENKNSTAASARSSDSYVYDIYVAQDDFSTVLKADFIDINDLSILEYNDYLYSCPRLTNDIDENELHDDYDDDSNDENNWRNDYPDEEEFSDSSIDERAMRRAMQNFDIDNELSSSAEEYHDSNNEGFVYSINSDDYGFDNDYDFTDADRYGTSYAKYKKRMMKDLQSDSENSNDDEEEEE